MPHKPPSHRPHAQAALAQRQAADRARKRAQGTRYNGARWRKLRACVLAARPVCEDCGRESATDVDHVLAWEDRPDLAFDEANLRALCHACHSRKTCAEDGGFGRKPKEGL